MALKLRIVLETLQKRSKIDENCQKSRKNLWKFQKIIKMLKNDENFKKS